MFDEAAEAGVDWFLYRLVIAEETRAPIEVHEARAFRHVFTDHAMLDALAQVRQIAEAKANPDAAARRRGLRR